MPRETILLTDVKVSDRVRVDLGDIKEFAESLSDKPLLHPIVIDEDNNLIAGERRFTAFKYLAEGNVEGVDPEKFKRVPFTRIAGLSESERRMLELEENFRRKDMTWQEYVLGIASYHRLKSLKQKVEGGDPWTQAMTGKLVKVSQGHVSIILKIAADLAATPKKSIWDCESLTAAIQYKLGQRMEEAHKEVLERLNRKRDEIQSAEGSKVSAPLSVDEILSSVPSAEGVETTERPTGPSAGISLEDCSKMVLVGDCLEVLRQIGRVDHIVCDPPFGINVDNMDSMANIDSVRETHQVSENLELLPKFLEVAYEVIAENGFLCMWYDLDHHNFLQDVAKKIGWKVCRWPFHWCKTHPCRNSAAQYNITKAVEHCMFLRRSEKSVLCNKVTKNYVLASNDAMAREADHPFFKPFDVWKPIIEAISYEGQTIVDPFAGECSSLIASFLLKRTPLGIELDEKHAIRGIQNLHKIVNAPSMDSLMFEAPL